MQEFGSVSLHEPAAGGLREAPAHQAQPVRSVSAVRCTNLAI